MHVQCKQRGLSQDRQTKEEEDPYINNEDVKRILGRESSGEGGSRWSDGASGRDEGKPGEEGDYMRPDEVMTTAVMSPTVAPQ